MKNNNDRLGRGLRSLLPDSLDLDDKDLFEAQETYFLCDIEKIQPNPYQPRKEMSENGLKELASSIREKGILQPLVINERTDDGYELIAGERRLRAAGMAGLQKVPVIIRKASQEERLELALIENIQRQNLNPLEEAMAYNKLANEFSMTQEEISQKVGKERSTVTNTLRLLQLPDYVKEDIQTGRLSSGHARVLLSMDNAEAIKILRDKIVSRGLSVRQAEKLARELKGTKTAPPRRVPKKTIPESYCNTLANEVTRHLGSKSKITQNGQRGKLEIEYYSLEDLERIHKLLLSVPAANSATAAQ
ncbi:MAG: ParB/RepB/Spo0J family partition protein [Desulfobulbaceae bacterium]|uniref:ParB/RepB/Spo0J family partition protein n=1 Tax=Candidatus Desulfobia pelagia TaxID=2841692 RepID=A0A8J6ND15_9BACT|nr:ParB/RepB/Spo0J family partition protein [Candidatus Desulfobia pelagia]